ncbi:hypothetical protein HQ560_15520 [bacterium]|nr:hypothetical protein [bacterium]
MKHFTLVLVSALLLAPLALAAEDAYEKQATWIDTLLHTKEMLSLDLADAKDPIPLPDFAKGAFTVCAWVRTKGDGSLFAKTKATGPWVSGGKGIFVRGGRLAYDIGWKGAVNGRTRVADGKWHHIAFTGARPQRFYVDGKLDGEGTLETLPDPAGSVFKIGHISSNFPHGGNGFTGEMDDVRLYGRALTPKEIAAHAAKPQPTKGKGLVGCWTFDGATLDVSDGLNHPTPVKTMGYTAGKYGKALQLKRAAHLVVTSGAKDPMAALWSRLAADFPDAASRSEMGWEREAGIWGADFTRTPLSDIAQRYAAAAERPTALTRQAKTLAAAARTAADLKAVRALYLRSRRYGEMLDSLAAYDLKGLRTTIRDLYDEPAPLLERLDALEAQAATWTKGEIPADALAPWKSKLDALRREAIVTRNPLFDFDKLVFVKRLTYSANHYYTEFINSSWTPGGNLCVLDMKTGKVVELCPSLEDGTFERFDLSYDATKIAFAWKGEHQAGYRIYEVNVDGSGLRQLTFPQKNEAWLVEQYRARPHYHHGTDDMHPCYLANGDIVFISTRCQYGILCDAPDDFTTTVLYRMDKDGKKMTKLSNSSVSEASPAILPDGRIMYTRWEYVDKGAVSVKCLWAMYPDGSASSEIYANDISLPPTFLYGRAIPDAVNHYVVLGTPHCPQNGIGTVIRLDMNGGDIRSRDPMTYMTPDVDIKSEGGFAFCEDGKSWHRDGGGNGRLFKDPYPLSKKYFLVSHKPAGTGWRDTKGYGLYLLDETGKVTLLYRDPAISAWLPYPLKARKKPPVPQTPRDPELAKQKLARCIVADVYHGLYGVPRGSIKYIRVIEQVPRPWACRRRWGGDGYDQQHVTITKDSHLGLKVQHGIVPVEDDGSAHFLVPAEANILLQVLDENHMAVQTERTFVNYMPGETRSCIGCHETPENAPRPFAATTLKALTRDPSMPGPQVGEKAGGRPLHYITDVQPVLDKHCVKCHSSTGPTAGSTQKPKGNLDLSGELTALFCVSYENLIPSRRGGKYKHSRRLLGPVIGENHPKTGNVHYLPARSLGSHSSVLVAMLNPGKVTLKDPKDAARAAVLAKEHKDVKLKPEEMVRITNWVDTNCQYYGSWWGRRNLQYKAHANFRPVPTHAVGLSMTSPIPEDER